MLGAEEMLHWRSLDFFFFYIVFNFYSILKDILKNRIEINIEINIDVYFGHAMHLAGSQFPSQGSNLGHGSESPES